MTKRIFANWKMYLNNSDAVKLANQLSGLELSPDTEVVVFPNTISLVSVKDVLSSKITVGAQNVGWTPSGAYTGATSAELFAEAGAKYALAGHSERRHVFGESNEDIRKRLEATIEAGLVPVLCIGETKEDKEEGKTEYRLKKQLMKALDGLELGDSELVVAYEPVWAISKGGDGEPCLPADADDIQGWIKREVNEYLGREVPVFYGGSVNADNVLSYLALESVDGILVGAASSKFDSFSSLIKRVEELN